jgi:SWI/SNF-related matrix-associated actin-dependent regulator 1 of chromatin subfamily A
MATPEHLVTQLAVIDRLDYFGGRGNFMKRYCWKLTAEEEIEIELGGDDMKEKLKKIAQKRHESSVELNKHLRSLCYIRRDKSEVLHDLPAKTRETVKLQLNAHHRAIYTQIETDLVSYLMERALQDEKFLTSLKQLSKKEREFAIAEYRALVIYQSARAEVLRKIGLCKQTAAMGKLEQAKDWIQSVLDSGEKLVVFVHHKKILRELREHFGPTQTMIIEGSQDRLVRPEEIAYIDKLIKKSKNPENEEYRLEAGVSTIRNYEISRFQIDPKCKLSICMDQAGGVGNTLTAASQVAFLELPWGPAQTDQCEDRCHRIGQKDSVTVHYLLAEDTIDEPIGELIESKRMIVNAVHDGDPMVGMEQGNIMGTVADLARILTQGKVVLLR